MQPTDLSSALLRTPPQRRWALAIVDGGMLIAMRAMASRQKPFARAYRYFAQLEDAGVIVPWTIEVDGYDDFELTDPVSSLPLYIAGPAWAAFAAAVRRIQE